MLFRCNISTFIKFCKKKKEESAVFFKQTHVVPAELQHRPDQGELLVDLLALQVGEDLLEAVADAVHGHVAAEDDAEGKHVEKDAALHGQLLVAGCRLLLWHAMLEGSIVKVHLVNLQELGEGLEEMKFEFPSQWGKLLWRGSWIFFRLKTVCICMFVAVTLLF